MTKKRTGMQIVADCIKAGRAIKAQAIKEEILREVARDVRR